FEKILDDSKSKLYYGLDTGYLEHIPHLEITFRDIKYYFILKTIRPWFKRSYLIVLEMSKHTFNPDGSLSNIPISSYTMKFDINKEIYESLLKRFEDELQLRKNIKAKAKKEEFEGYLEELLIDKKIQ